MTARIPLPDGWADRPFRVGDALDAGVGSGMGRGPVRRTELEGLCRSLLVRMKREAFFTHTTAALLLGLPVPTRLAQLRPVHVGIPAPASAMVARDIVGHSLRIVPDDLVDRGSLRVTGPARTWLDLAALLTVGELVAVGDYLLYWRSPILTRGELADALEKYPSRTGLTRARTALPLLRTRSESPRESMLRVIIVLAGLPEPECNYNVFDEQGRFGLPCDSATGSATGRSARRRR